VISFIVPVMKNFRGLSELIQSVDEEIYPIIIPNWVENVGVSKGWNDGLSKAIDMGSEYAVISNDDVLLNPGTIHKMVMGLNDFDLVSATNTRDDESYEGYDEHPDFSCFAVKPKEFISKFGWFDENFSPAYFEDNDMARRMIISGGTYRRDLSATMFHRGSVTQNMDGPVVTSPMFERNREYYTRKWGGWPGSEVFTSPFNDSSKTIKDW
jgi:GT2 family glycosyltransferase